MSDFGSRLKSAREARGIDLRDLAARTKISVTTLEALERSDVSKVPGGIFGRAFVRSYAVEVGLEPEAVVADFVAGVTEEERRAAERGAIRVEITADDRAFLERQRRAVSTLRIVVTCAAVLSVAFLAWRLRSVWSEKAPSTPVANLDRPPVSLTPPPPASSPGEALTAGQAAAPVETPVTTPAPVAARPAAPSVAAKAIVVDIELTEDAWIFVQSDGGRVVSELFRAGDRRRFEANDNLLLDVGNVGGFRWSINGVPAKLLGRTGVHQRITLTPRNLSEYLQ